MRLVAQLILIAMWLGFIALLVEANVAERRNRRTPRSRYEKARWKQ